MQTVSKQRAVALARLFRLLESARPADARAVATALPEAELAAAVAAARGRVSLPIREYILAEGPSCVLAALAREAAHLRGEAAASTVDRVLLRFDPEADAAFFEPDPPVGLAGLARRRILRDRRGPDGRAVIPPRVKQSLLDAVAGDGRPEGWLLDDLATADDPDLVLAAARHARHLSGWQAASVILTLDAYGRRAEAKQHRALWFGRGKNFSLLGFRRFAAVHENYAVAASFTPAHDESVEALSAEQYRELVEQNETAPTPAAFSRLRVAALAALRAGTMSAAEVLEHTRPAALTMTIAVDDDDYDDDAEPRPGERRAADDLRRLIVRHASEALGNRPKRWARAVARVNFFEGTLLELLADPRARSDHGGENPAVFDYSSCVILDFDPANTLLALAPRDVADQALAASRKGWVTTAAGNYPLCRALVEHIITRGSVRQRERLAGNEFTPDSVLSRLMDGAEDGAEKTDVMLAIMDRDGVGQEIVQRAYAEAPRDDDLKDWIVDRAGMEPPAALAALRCMTDDPAWILSVLRSFSATCAEAVRIAAYELLAEVAGAEAVWALELERRETLDAMAPYVRASMAAGNAAPLIEAARANPLPPGLRSTHANYGTYQVTEHDVDNPFSRPLEDAIRRHLDGRLDRWLHLADLLEKEAEAPLDDQQPASVPVADLIRYWPEEG